MFEALEKLDLLVFRLDLRDGKKPNVPMYYG
jgi:hypothetical protein